MTIHQDLAHAHLEHDHLGRGRIVSYHSAVSRTRKRGRAGVGLQRRALLTTTGASTCTTHHDEDSELNKSTTGGHEEGSGRQSRCTLLYSARKNADGVVRDTLREVRNARRRITPAQHQCQPMHTSLSTQLTRAWTSRCVRCVGLPTRAKLGDVYVAVVPQQRLFPQPRTTDAQQARAHIRDVMPNSIRDPESQL
jgi:hypothetical protein